MELETNLFIPNWYLQMRPIIGEAMASTTGSVHVTYWRTVENLKYEKQTN